MRKILIFSVFAALAVTGCKKKEDTISTLHTYSAPTIIITGAQYYSIPTGGTLPSIQATAYDSFYKENCNIIMDQSTLDNSTPGLYVVNITAKNHLGMASSLGVYVAVTDISPLINLAGAYTRALTGAPVNVTRLANGLYQTDNVGGNVPSTGNAYFVQTDLTTIDLPSQNTPDNGTIFATDAAVNMTVGDTTYQYVLNPGSVFSPTTRVFQKL